MQSKQGKWFCMSCLCAGLRNIVQFSEPIPRSKLTVGVDAVTISGSIDAIGVSGRYWIGGNEQGAYDLLVSSLLQAKTSIRIVAYSLGTRVVSLTGSLEYFGRRSIQVCEYN